MRGYLPQPDLFVIHLGGDCFWAYGAEGGPLDAKPSWHPHVITLARKHWWHIDWSRGGS